MKILSLAFMLLGTASLFSQNVPIVSNQSLISNDVNVLFRGFENILVVKAKLGDTNTYVLKSDDCSIHSRRNDGTRLKHGQYIVKPIGRARTTQIEVYDCDHLDKSILTLEYSISNVPAGQVYLDHTIQGEELVLGSGKISVKQPSGSLLVWSEEVIKWGVTFGDQQFDGTGDVLTKEVVSSLNALNSGTVVQLICNSVSEDQITRKRSAQFTIR